MNFYRKEGSLVASNRGLQWAKGGSGSLVSLTLA